MGAGESAGSQRSSTRSGLSVDSKKTVELTERKTSAVSYPGFAMTYSFIVPRSPERVTSKVLLSAGDPLGCLLESGKAGPIRAT